MPLEPSSDQDGDSSTEAAATTGAATTPIASCLDPIHWSWALRYLRKAGGVAGSQSPAPAPVTEALYSTVIALASLVAVAVLHRTSLPGLHDLDFLIGSFGASAVLATQAHDSPLSQPMNMVGGHLSKQEAARHGPVLTRAVSAVIGVGVNRWMPSSAGWLAGSMAVAVAVGAMALTNTTHPPGGATALLAVVGSDHLRALGFWFVLQPVLTGVTVMIICAVALNNLHPGRQYPAYWLNRVRRT